MGNPLSAAVIIAGGQGRRLGGRDKPALLVGGRSLLDIAIDAVGDCPIVVVGPTRDLPAGVLTAREEPPGGGPAAGVAAGVAALPVLPTAALLAVLAADLPGIDRNTVRRLASAVATTGPSRAVSYDGAVLIDASGHRQFMVGVWRAERLAAAIAVRRTWDGAPLRTLLGTLSVLEIPGVGRETEDVDTLADWERWQS